jgi:hypothetical protein
MKDALTVEEKRITMVLTTLLSDTYALCVRYSVSQNKKQLLKSLRKLSARLSRANSLVLGLVKNESKEKTEP